MADTTPSSHQVGDVTTTTTTAAAAAATAQYISNRFVIPSIFKSCGRRSAESARAPVNWEKYCLAAGISGRPSVFDLFIGSRKNVQKYIRICQTILRIFFFVFFDDVSDFI